MKPQPIIPWMGGKRRLARHLLPLFPPHECYVELFCGGGALYFLRPEPARVEVLNDLNGDLVNLYRVVQNHLDEFIRQFRWALSSRQMFDWTQQMRPETLTDVQRAARFYYLQQHVFSGKVTGRTFAISTTTRPINLLRIEERLSAAHLRLGGATIENLPWEQCVQRYDRPHSFFYMDPPYWDVSADYGVPFDWSHYERLAQAMRTMQGKAMLSINDHPDIRKAFGGLQMHQFPLTYTPFAGVGDRKGKEVVELAITNYT